jgi:hypothetical protein
MKVDSTSFVARYSEWDSKANAEAKAGLLELIEHLNTDLLVTDVRWAAYMLATVKLECGNTWKPIVERGDPAYFNKYEPPATKAHELGNDTAGDGFRYRGRGFVQLTGKANYRKASKALGLANQLVDTPELALNPANSYAIMSYGMRTGLFTSAKLSTYIHGNVCDYVHARRIINGADRAGIIAGYAQALEEMLRLSSA